MKLLFSWPLDTFACSVRYTARTCMRSAGAARWRVAWAVLMAGTVLVWQSNARWPQVPAQSNALRLTRRPSLIIERIFEEVEAPVAVLAEPPLWRAWSRTSVIRAPGRRCSWARFTPPRTPGMSQPPANGSICLRNETDLLCDEVRRLGYWPECADLPGLFDRAVAKLAADVEPRPHVSMGALGPLLFVDAGG